MHSYQTPPLNDRTEVGVEELDAHIAYNIDFIMCYSDFYGQQL